MHIMWKIGGPLLLAGTLLMGADAGCGEPYHQSVAEMREREQTNTLMDAMSSAVGMPALVRFTEKRQLKMLYEMRDDPKLATFTYITDLNGKLHLLCQSFGYGIPYATQFSSPHKAATYGAEGIAMQDQPEPNGLYPPPAADGTWIMCLDPGKSNEVKPVYVEPRVVVSPWKLTTE